MTKKSIVIGLASAALTFSANMVFADTYATAIFDNTGSMQNVRTADGFTRCEFGKQLFLETVAAGINRADYFDVRTFSSPGALESISNGFVNVKGMSTETGTGKQLFDNMTSEINSLTCNGYSTALGDALCDTADSLRVSGAGSNSLKMAIVTDAGENASSHCGGSDYVADHIVPKLFQQPRVQFNVTILTAPGNVDSRSYQTQANEQFEDGAPSRAPSGARGVREEIQDLMLISKFSGGEAAVIDDSQTCTSGCAPMDGEEAVIGNDDPWGGAW